jgi:DNA repair exonuclease SbcCD ATPase subunit
MWPVFVFVWLAFLAIVAIFAQQAFGYDFTHLPAHFQALPLPQRLAASAIAVMASALIGASIWQAQRASRQQKSLKLLRDRLKTTREDTVVAHALQSHFDAAARHLAENDPEEAIVSIQKRLSDTEQTAAAQQSLNQASDMQEQLTDIRRRQKELREKVGVIAEQRRVMEPVFAEIRDRQRQLERSLGELETDDHKNGVAVRLKELDQDVASILGRMNTLQDSFAALNRYKEQLEKSQAELVPLRAPEAGLHALIRELRAGHAQLARTLDELETHGEQPLGSRVEALSKDKLELEQRVARVDDCFHILDAIRLDFEELGQQRRQLERSLAEVETDSNGNSLVERQNALNEFVIQSRIRLGALQETFMTLDQFKKELAKARSDLVPLQAPVFGIEAMIGDVNAIRNLLAATLCEIETSGDSPLSSRVETLAKSKRELEERIAKIFENFTTLDLLRKDIGGIFTTIRGTLNRIG